ncbi:unnamed protein product [Chrysoparadoxa australica]
MISSGSAIVKKSGVIQAGARKKIMRKRMRWTARAMSYWKKKVSLLSSRTTQVSCTKLIRKQVFFTHISTHEEEEPLDKGDAEPPAPSSDPVQMPKAEETTSGQGRLVNESRFALLQKTTQALCKNLRDYTNKLMGCGVGQPETQRAGTSSSGSGGDYVPFSLRWVLLGVGVAIGAAGIAHLFSSRLGTSLEGKKPTEQPKM